MSDQFTVKQLADAFDVQPSELLRPAFPSPDPMEKAA